MRKIILLLFTLTTINYVFAQTSTKNNCNELKSKGYKQQFCDYNTKYAFKNISSESSLESISSKLHLTRKSGSPNQYDCKDDDVLSWALITFDNCIFDFSSTGKLDGVQLQLTHRVSYEKGSKEASAEIKRKMETVKEYLITYFGKPEYFPGTTNLMWRGSKVRIILSSISESMTGAYVAIYRTNENVIDDL